LKLVKANVALSGARANWKAAKSEFEKANEIIASLPAGHPNGTRALERANAGLSQARKELREALREYVESIRTEERNKF
jgi:hypothetical protein